MAINKIDLGGRIVSEISLRETTKGIPVADFRIKHISRKSKNPLFVDIEVWSSEAQRVYETIKKGDMVVIVGELRRDIWASKENGEPRSKIKITASRVVLSERSQSWGEQEIVQVNQSGV